MLKYMAYFLCKRKISNAPVEEIEEPPDEIEEPSQEGEEQEEPEEEHISGESTQEDQSLQCLPVIFTFNSKSGEAIGEFKYRTLDTINPEDILIWDNAGNETENTENVGDMIKSPYLYICDRNYPDKNGNVLHWSTDAKSNSHVFIHDIEGGIDKVSIEYKNMYW